MKGRILTFFAILSMMILVTSISDAKALRVVYTIEQMTEHADAIAIGTIESTWIDIRPFDEDYKIIDMATIHVEEWLKEDKDDGSSGKTLNIRYYGHWAKTIDSFFGVSRMDTPIHSYETGQKILALTTHEEPTMVMGEGYYPFYEGVFVIKDDVAVQRTEDPPILLEQLRQTIVDNLGEKSNDNASTDDKIIPAEIEDAAQPERFCAYIGFEKYPDNLFAEFLENPHNNDVTFLNFTDSDLKQIPEFYELVLEANQLDYPLNDLVRFTISPEEHRQIMDHLEQRTYSEFNKKGETLLHQTGESNIHGYYRLPQILIDGKLYGINGLQSSQIFSDRDVHVNIEYNGTIDDVKKRLVENTNPNRANLIYFEINDDDREPLETVLDAIYKIQKSNDKIRMSEDVGGKVQDRVQDFFVEQNNIQFDNNNSKHTKYFLLNGTLYETSFVIC